MIDASRRKFFGVVAAVPVVATAAAAKLGLVSAASSASHNLLPGTPISSGYAAPNLSWVEQIRQNIKDFWSDDAKEIRENEASHMAKVLDPDLASLRSISPSAAYTMQRGRASKKLEYVRMKDLNRTLIHALKNYQ